MSAPALAPFGVQKCPARPGQMPRQQRHQVGSYQGKNHEGPRDLVETDLGEKRHPGLLDPVSGNTCQAKRAET